MDKDDWMFCALIGGVIVCSPLIGLYYTGKWLYNHTPQKIKERRAINAEIKALEEKLGLYGRDEKALYYDDHYVNRGDNEREDYLKDLRKKVEEGYASPDLIIVIQHIYAELCIPFLYNMESNAVCKVLFMARKDIYNFPQDMVVDRALSYFGYFDDKWSRTIDAGGRLMTLSECGHYKNYFLVHVPGMFRMNEVQHSERLQAFIEKFKRENKIMR